MEVAKLKWKHKLVGLSCDHIVRFIQFIVITILVIPNDFLVQCAYQPYRHTDPDYASSVHHLKSLVIVELHLLPSIFSVYQTEIRTASHVNMKSYINDFETSILGALNPKISLDQFVALLNSSYINTGRLADDIVKHPLKSYRTVRRFVRFIEKFPEITKTQALTNALAAAQQVIPFPKESDLEAAMQNILRLRQIYKISIADLLQGRLENLKTKSGLTVTHLVELADHAANLKMYIHSVDMYEGAIRRCEENRPIEFFYCSTMLDKTEIQRKLDEAIQEHDKLLHSLLENEEQSDWNTTPPDSSPYIFSGPLGNANSSTFSTRTHLDLDEEMDAFMENKEASQEEKDLAVSPYLFEKLCRGDKMKGTTSPSLLRCYYVNHTHPTYLLGPVKVEVHNENPFLVQIYDVISDQEIKDLQTEVQEEMRQSRTAAMDGEDTGTTSRFRTSANAWIEDNASEKFKYLNERISRITGLNTTGYFSSEIVQIAAYNPGCHYTPHSDAIFEDTLLGRLPESEFHRGDRMVTFMLYLSDVEKGGGTGFPTLKALVKPVKGSGVMWYNLNSDGSINYNVMHGGCPVLYGTKWIANKWIRSNDQMFIKKCTNTKEAWRL